MATELPDLGAFTTVFRALNNLQAPRAFSIPPGAGATAAEHDSDVSAEPTVWSHTPVASYLARDPELSENSQESRSPSPSASGGSASGSGSDTEGEADAQTVEIEEISDVDEGDQPSLGYLDEALSFIAAERARYAALREAGAKGSGATLGHGVERRRKRRQRRAKTLLQGEPLDGAGRVTTVAAVDATAEEDDSSSSFERSHSSRFQSTPATPRRRKKEKEERSLVEENSKLSHSKSTPSLRLSLVMPPSPRVLQLRSLAHKLRLLFPADESALTAILSNDFADRDNFVDPRGPVPRSQDTLIHVFIDQYVCLGWRVSVSSVDGSDATARIS
jgi:hypothetical protein